MIRTADTYTGYLAVKKCEAKFTSVSLNKTEFKPGEIVRGSYVAKNTGGITTDLVVKTGIGTPGYPHTRRDVPPGGYMSGGTGFHVPSTPGSYKFVFTVEACGKETDRREIPFTVIEEKKEPKGDITRVELDSELLPEGGTLDWKVNEEATIKVYFKNVGNAPGKFHIWVTDEDGATLCDVTPLTEIPADGVERCVKCGSFTPTVVEKKTLTAHIEP